MRFACILISLTLILSLKLSGQDHAWITGTVNNEKKQPVFSVNVFIPNTGSGTTTNEEGKYRLKIPPDRTVAVVFSSVGYRSDSIRIAAEAGEEKNFDMILQTAVEDLEEVTVSKRYFQTGTLSMIGIKSIRMIPGPSRSIEHLIATFPGVSSRNELSSQYMVRGGNFDENLVYVNDVEIFRPFLIRSGQQEGISFVNPDMVSSVSFSAGGFDATFGDKMSSVLDIKYRKPVERSGHANISLLGGNLHLEGTSDNRKFTHNSGLRYKTTRYLLNSLETKGEYLPDFLDFQTYLTWQLNPKWDFSLLGNIAKNEYRFIPQTRQTDFGTFQSPLNLTIYYDGNEKDKYLVTNGAITVRYNNGNRLNLALTASGAVFNEQEAFDIRGQYLINELDNTPNSETYGDSIMNIGVGTFLNHARNYLDAYVYNLAHRGSYRHRNIQLKWGIKYRADRIFDQLSEWEMIDSSGYAVPYSGNRILLKTSIRSENRLVSGRFETYIQNTFRFRPFSSVLYFTTGIRMNYWDFNRQFLLSPRLTLSMKPGWDPDFIFRFSSGYYQQPPFYKEMRYPDGGINQETRAQESIHFVLGGDHFFDAWGRPFKLTAELYYKHLNHLIPYKLDNVKIEYAAVNSARGYSMGLDMKIHGEFVRDAESWASLGIMKTAEDIRGDFYLNEEDERIEPGFYPRPTDQRISFGLFFQDYLPNNPDYKFSITFLYGSKLPFSPPNTGRYDLTYRMPAYKRVDLGFSKILKRADQYLAEGNPFRHFQSIWLGAEIFNLLGVNNTISYLWIKTVSNQQRIPGMFAVPNYMTSRRFNLKLTARF